MAEDDNREVWSSLAGAGESVLAIGLLAWLGVAGGGWLDTRLHTAPWLQIVLALVGVGLGLTRMVLKALKAEKK